MMTTAARLLCDVEAYAHDRLEEKRLRREMRALRCESPSRAGAADFRCYRQPARYGTSGRGDCAPCTKRRVLWVEFVAVRAGNKRALRRIEHLALRLNESPASDQPETPGPLLEMMATDG
jgi:hypothetical protein